MIFHVCPPVRRITISLKLVDYLCAHVNNQWYNYYLYLYPLTKRIPIIPYMTLRSKANFCLTMPLNTCHESPNDILGVQFHSGVACPSFCKVLVCTVLVV